MGQRRIERGVRNSTALFWFKLCMKASTRIQSKQLYITTALRFKWCIAVVFSVYRKAAGKLWNTPNPRHGPHSNVPVTKGLAPNGFAPKDGKKRMAPPVPVPLGSVDDAYKKNGRSPQHRAGRPVSPLADGPFNFRLLLRKTDYAPTDTLKKMKDNIHWGYTKLRVYAVAFHSASAR